MLDKSMIDQKAFQPQLEIYSLKRVVEDTVNIMKGQASLKQIQLISIFDQEDVSVKIDRMRSLQILLNLISNSLKFSKDGEFVGIYCDYKTDPEDSSKFVVTFKVVDNGIGISEADRPNIFKPFFKTSDATSKEYNSSGHGLGLSICNQIAQGLGGQISFESKPGEGTTFSFSFSAPILDKS